MRFPITMQMHSCVSSAFYAQPWDWSCAIKYIIVSSEYWLSWWKRAMIELRFLALDAARKKAKKQINKKWCKPRMSGYDYRNGNRMYRLMGFQQFSIHQTNCTNTTTGSRRRTLLALYSRNICNINGFMCSCRHTIHLHTQSVCLLILFSS